MGFTVEWLIAIVFVFVGILFLIGHGWRLIAGYNTASKEKKAKYDLERLYLVNGIGMLVLGILVATMNVFVDDWTMLWQLLFLVFFIIVLIVIVVLNGTWCMKR